jgi:hypothetical protein
VIDVKKHPEWKQSKMSKGTSVRTGDVKSKVYGLGDLADMTALSINTIRRMSSAGRIPGRLRISHKVIRHDREVVDAWFASGCLIPK